MITPRVHIGDLDVVFAWLFIAETVSYRQPKHDAN
jgi:hypothetical protein